MAAAHRRRAGVGRGVGIVLARVRAALHQRQFVDPGNRENARKAQKKQANPVRTWGLLVTMSYSRSPPSASSPTPICQFALFKKLTLPEFRRKLTSRMATGTHQVVIQNPVINSPFAEPQRHFRFSDEGITSEIVAERRTSSYFIPIAATKKKGKQLNLTADWLGDRVEPNKFINQVRSRVKQWRENKHFGVTRTTAQLLQYWTRSDRERRLFFCQIEALETLIYLTEVAKHQGDTWIENAIHTANADANQ